MKKSIMVVDDSVAILDVVKIALEMADCECEEVSLVALYDTLLALT